MKQCKSENSVRISLPPVLQSEKSAHLPSQLSIKLNLILKNRKKKLEKVRQAGTNQRERGSSKTHQDHQCLAVQGSQLKRQWMTSQSSVQVLFLWRFADSGVANEKGSNLTGEVLLFF